MIKVTNGTKKSNDCKIRLVINLGYELTSDESDLFIKKTFNYCRTTSNIFDISRNKRFSFEI